MDCAHRQIKMALYYDHISYTRKLQLGKRVDFNSDCTMTATSVPMYNIEQSLHLFTDYLSLRSHR